MAVGEHLEPVINNIIGMGFEREQVVLALRAAFFNPDRAIEYLLTVQTILSDLLGNPSSPHWADSEPVVVASPAGCPSIASWRSRTTRRKCWRWRGKCPWCWWCYHGWTGATYCQPCFLAAQGLGQIESLDSGSHLTIPPTIQPQTLQRII